MICPLILKQTRKTENGLEEWEHQPCLEEACSLFFVKKKKCSLSNNSENTHEMRNILERVDFVSSFQVLTTGLNLQKGVNEELQSKQEDLFRQQGEVREEIRTLSKELSEEAKARQEELCQKQETIQEQIGALSKDLSGDLLNSLSERIEAVQEVLQSFSDRMHQSMETLDDRLNVMDERITKKIEEWQLELQARDSASQERIENVEKDLREVLQQGLDLTEKMSSEHTEGVTKMEALMGETRELMTDLLEGNREMQNYYAEQKSVQEEEAARRKKEEAREQNNRGVVYFQRGVHEAAVLAFEKAAELDSEYAEAYNNLGLTYTELGRSDHAIRAFERAITLRPEFGEALNNLGLLYYTLLDYERATEMFSKALEDGCKDRSVAYTNFANSLYQLHRYEDAATAWNKALQINPLNQKAKKGLALISHQEQGAV